MSFYGEIGNCTPDKLIAGENVPINVKGVTVATGQGTLARGTVLGKSPVNDKFYKVDKATEPVVKRTLQITGTTTKTATLALAGLTASSLKVRVGDENGALAEAGETKDYTAAYAGDTLVITVVANGKLVGVAQCYIEISKAAAGANVADCILADEVVTGTSADVTAQAYTSGMFNRNALIVGGNGATILDLT
jgi:hypothetical protein